MAGSARVCRPSRGISPGLGEQYSPPSIRGQVRSVCDYTLLVGERLMGLGRERRNPLTLSSFLRTTVDYF